MNKHLVVSLVYCLVAMIGLTACDNTKSPQSQSGSDNCTDYTLRVTGDATVLQKTADVLQKRLVAYGIDNPDVKVDNGRIVVKVPSQEDQGSIKMLLEWGGDVGFYETYDEAGFGGGLDDFAHNTDDETGKSLAELFDFNKMSSSVPVVGFALPGDTAVVNRIVNMPAVKTSLPAGLKLVWSAKNGYVDKDRLELIALRTVDGAPAMDGSTIISATSEQDQYGENVVSMCMNDEGARQWSRMTEHNIARAIAIVIDNKVYCHPVVNSQIDGGRVSIASRFTDEEAKCMAAVLQGGKLPAAVTIIPKK